MGKTKGVGQPGILEGGPIEERRLSSFRGGVTVSPKNFP